MKYFILTSMAFVLICAFLNSQTADSTNGYVINNENDIAKEGPGPHNGKGVTIGYPFFEDVKDLKFAFRKRIFKPGSSIGKHTQESDEVYYCVSGNGTMIINEKSFSVKPGDAFLTRTNSTHELIQTGNKDLVIIISYIK